MRMRKWSILLAPVVALALAGCSGADAESGEKVNTVEENNSIGAGIAEELMTRDGVTSAEVAYVDTFTAPKSTLVDIEVEPGVDVEALYDEAVRLVWQSEINPISLIYLNVFNPDDPRSGISRNVDVDKPGVVPDLEEKYGPHPN
ncbi:hypothetical protein [Blastococcus sp. LR1]|uniref:hypothetical protein n=1 Tax=Blastococcus sp. LR1 TaxID=2877000 RepID=UPI001CCD4AE1|nr:hypothetical protein [Blastococcus sp. LR1]MCA0143767.1 hypothetical protein [Blastococcus sp. LR1]